MKFLKNSKGFTLAELLIVMAVVVVLAAATIPAIADQTEAAKQSNDLAALSNAYTQAFTEVSLLKAGEVAPTGEGDAAAYTATAIPVTFQQTGGAGKIFDKFPTATIGTYTVKNASGVAKGQKSVTFTFKASDLTVTKIEAA